jgi:phenylalanyl-tRNA synthetase beta chain
MNIKILDSDLRKYLKTKATANEIAEKLSLTSLSVERLEKFENDFIYEMEITTNRPDLFCVLGIAREAAAILPGFGLDAEFIPLKLQKPQNNNVDLIEIKNDPKLVNRICAVLMDIKVSDSPKEIKNTLETSDIRSLNNIIDITNYVMRIVGHPAHVFDFDRLNTKTLEITEAKQGDKITTLDGKNYTLNGGEIIAIDDNKRIVDLLGIMGLENSVVTKDSKRILFFLDNNEPGHIREASMNLGIRTEAAVLNEKGIDPNLTIEALLFGIELFEKLAQGKIVGKIIDIFDNKPTEKEIEVSFEKIDNIIGVKIDPKVTSKTLKALGFENTLTKTFIKVTVPSSRSNDIEIEEDIIEEIARTHGYHNLPSILPPNLDPQSAYPFMDGFYFEKKIKNALKYWGFSETYAYSFVSENLFEGPIDSAVTVANPLTEEFVYMRNSLIPSLLKVVTDNKSFENLRIFEIANIYKKRVNDLPDEILMLSAVIKNKNVNFFEVKGIIEQLAKDLGIKNLFFKKSVKSGVGSSVYLEKEYLGEIEVLDNNLINFELNFQTLLKYANDYKIFKAFAKYPPIMEDLSVVLHDDIKTEDLVNEIKKQDKLITMVSLKDSYKDSRTFHIVYQDPDKNLTNEEISKIRQKIINALTDKFKTSFKN